MSSNYKTDYLFPESTFLSGMASVVDLTGDLFTYNKSETPEEADSKAIFNDWAVIGQDISCAHEQQTKSKK